MVSVIFRGPLANAFHQWFPLYSSCALSPSGPLLFFLYIKDLSNFLSNCEPRMCADETHNTYVSDNEHDKDRQTKRGITECSQLVKSKQTSLNMTKTELMFNCIWAKVKYYDSFPNACN